MIPDPDKTPNTILERGLLASTSALLALALWVALQALEQVERNREVIWDHDTRIALLEAEK
jgi:hypothetical protein